MFALSYVHMSIKFIPTHLKHSGRYFLTYGKNLLLEKFRCLRVFVCVYMRAHVHAVCVRVPKNKHGRLREGGTRTSHILARTSRMWRSSPPRAHRPLWSQHHWCHQNQAQKRPGLEADFRITELSARIPGFPQDRDTQSDCAHLKNMFNNISAKTKCWSNAI